MDGVSVDGKCTNAWKGSVVSEVKYKPMDDVEAKYRMTYSAESRWLVDGRWELAAKRETIAVISGLVDMLSQFKSPITCWYFFVSGICVCSGRLDAGILSTGKPLLKGVALVDLLQELKLCRSTISRIKASW